ncbi:MAG: hypothetical protein ACI87I_001526 [Pseudoalteromonas tetraodonis]|jgi:hypothetical protein
MLFYLRLAFFIYTILIIKPGCSCHPGYFFAIIDRELTTKDYKGVFKLFWFTRKAILNFA